jgi:hypothetical protein
MIFSGAYDAFGTEDGPWGNTSPFGDYPPQWSTSPTAGIISVSLAFAPSSTLAWNGGAYLQTIPIAASSTLDLSNAFPVGAQFFASSVLNINLPSLNGLLFAGSSTLVPGDASWVNTPATVVVTNVRTNPPIRVNLPSFTYQVSLSMASKFAIGEPPYAYLAGNTIVLPVTVTQGGSTSTGKTPVNLTGASITFAISQERSPELFDAQPIFTKSIGNGIVVNSATAGTFTITLASSDTLALNGGRYYMECDLTDAAGNVTTLFYGSLALRANLT